MSKFSFSKWLIVALALFICMGSVAQAQILPTDGPAVMSFDNDEPLIVTGHPAVLDMDEFMFIQPQSTPAAGAVQTIQTILAMPGKHGKGGGGKKRGTVLACIHSPPT